MSHRKRAFQQGRDRRKKNKQEKRKVSDVPPHEVRRNQQIVEKAELLLSLLKKASEYFTHRTSVVGGRIESKKNDCCAQIDDPQVAIAVRSGFENVSSLLETSLMESVARLAGHVTSRESPVSTEQFATTEIDMEIKRWVNLWLNTLLELAQAQANVEQASMSVVIEAQKGELDLMVAMLIESIDEAIPRWELDVDDMVKLFDDVSKNLESVRKTKQDVEQQLTKLAAFEDMIKSGSNDEDQELLARLNEIKKAVTTQEERLIATTELISESKSRLNAKIVEARDVKGALVVLERIKNREEEFVYSNPEVGDNEITRQANKFEAEVTSFGDEIKKLRETVNGIRPRLSTELDVMMNRQAAKPKPSSSTGVQSTVSSMCVTSEQSDVSQEPTTRAAMPAFRATNDQQYVLVSVVVMHAYPEKRGLGIGIKTLCDAAITLGFLEDKNDVKKAFKAAVYEESQGDDGTRKIIGRGTGKGRYLLYKPTNIGVDSAKPILPD